LFTVAGVEPKIIVEAQRLDCPSFLQSYLQELLLKTWF
jgi:hypothetical protein